VYLDDVKYVIYLYYIAKEMNTMQHNILSLRC